MSILDTSFADPISTLSPWDRLYSRLVAEREITNDALRRRTPIEDQPRTAAELRADIAKFNRWLDTTTVQAGTDFANWVRARKATAMAELADLTAGGVR